MDVNLLYVCNHQYRLVAVVILHLVALGKHQCEPVSKGSPRSQTCWSFKCGRCWRVTSTEDLEEPIKIESFC